VKHGTPHKKAQQVQNSQHSPRLCRRLPYPKDRRFASR